MRVSKRLPGAVTSKRSRTSSLEASLRGSSGVTALRTSPSMTLREYTLLLESSMTCQLIRFSRPSLLRSLSSRMRSVLSYNNSRKSPLASSHLAHQELTFPLPRSWLTWKRCCKMRKHQPCLPLPPRRPPSKTKNSTLTRVSSQLNRLLPLPNLAKPNPLVKPLWKQNHLKSLKKPLKEANLWLNQLNNSSNKSNRK